MIKNCTFSSLLLDGPTIRPPPPPILLSSAPSSSALALLQFAESWRVNSHSEPWLFEFAVRIGLSELPDVEYFCSNSHSDLSTFSLRTRSYNSLMPSLALLVLSISVPSEVLEASFQGRAGAEAIVFTAQQLFWPPICWLASEVKQTCLATASWERPSHLIPLLFSGRGRIPFYHFHPGLGLFPLHHSVAAAPAAAAVAAAAA